MAPYLNRLLFDILRRIPVHTPDSSLYKSLISIFFDIIPGIPLANGQRRCTCSEQHISDRAHFWFSLLALTHSRRYLQISAHISGFIYHGFPRRFIKTKENLSSNHYGLGVVGCTALDSSRVGLTLDCLVFCVICRPRYAERVDFFCVGHGAGWRLAGWYTTSRFARCYSSGCISSHIYCGLCLVTVRLG